MFSQYSDPDNLSVRRGKSKTLTYSYAHPPVRLAQNNSSEDLSSEAPHPQPSPIIVGGDDDPSSLISPPDEQVARQQNRIIDMRRPDGVITRPMGSERKGREDDFRRSEGSARSTTELDDRLVNRRPLASSTATVSSIDSVSTPLSVMQSPSSVAGKPSKPMVALKNLEPPTPLSPYITDVIIVGHGQKPPQGYHPIRYFGETCGPPPFATRAAQIYIERSLTKPPVTGIVVYFPNKDEFPPPQYVECRTSSKGSGDLNAGGGAHSSSGKALLALIRGDGMPVMDLGYCNSTQIPTNWTGLERSPMGFRAILFNRGGVTTRSVSAPGGASTGNGTLGGSIGERQTSLSSSTAIGSGGTILCIKYDSRELSRFRENDMIRHGLSMEGDSVYQQQQQQNSRRRASLIGQLVGSVTPTVIPLRKTVLTRRGTSTTQSPRSSLTSPKQFFGASAASPQDPQQQEDPFNGQRNRSDGENGGKAFVSRLQNARERAMVKSHMEDGLGMSALAFDPEVAGLLVTTETLDRVVSAMTNVSKGSVFDAFLALKDLLSMVLSLEVLPSVPMSQQMTLYDFVVAFGASLAVERGIDLLLAPACQIVVSGCKEAKNGLHPVTLHHTLSVVCRSYEFYSQVRDDFFIQKAHALAQEAAMGFSHVPSSDRLDSIVARLATGGASAPSFPTTTKGTPSSSSFMMLPASSPLSSSSSSEPAFHFVFPVETAEQMLSDRTYVLVQTVHSLFADILERCASTLKGTTTAMEDRSLLNQALERIDAMIDAGGFSLQTTLEAYLHLLKAFDNTSSPVVDALLGLAWLCGYSAGLPVEGKTVLLQDLLIRMSRLDSDLIGCAVRKLVFPLAMKRLGAALGGMHSVASDTSRDGGMTTLEDALCLLSVLWRCYRRFLKAEICIAFHSVIIPGLRVTSPVLYRQRMLELVTTWLDSDRATLVEIFLNFESDSPVPHWTILSDLIDALCALLKPRSLIQLGAAATATPAVKSAKASIQSSSSSRSKSVTGGEGIDVEHDQSLEERVASDAASALVSCLRHLVNLSGTIQTSASSNSLAELDSKGPVGAQHGREMHAESTSEWDVHRLEEEKQTREMLHRALKSEGSAKSAVNFLIAAGYLENSPSAVAQFLRLHLAELGEESVGDYLGEGGKSSTDQKFMVTLRDCYVKAASRNPKDSFDKALRRYLTSGGFRLPGEGQKVERLIEAFARRYCLDHPDQGMTEEGILLLSFSLVMLNTDLHKPQIKQKSKMKKEDFFKQVSGINGGKDFQRDFLEDLYDSIAKNEIRFPTVLQSASTQPANTTTTGGGGGGEPTQTEVLLQLATTVERGLSILSTLPDDRNFVYHLSLTRSVARAIFETISAKIFQIVSLVLEEQAMVMRFEIVSAALEMLEYAITVTLFLQVKGSDRRAFVSLLARMAMLCGLEDGDAAPLSSAEREQRVAKDEHLSLDWVEDILHFELRDQDIGILVGKIHTTVLEVAERISNRHKEQKLLKISARLGLPELMTSNTDRSFIKEGSIKVKNKDKILFLFSDCLIRAEHIVGSSAAASNNNSSKLRVEENLPLRTLRVFPHVEMASDVSQLVVDSSFEVRSPLSSFVCIAPSKRDKEAWIREISAVISTCLESHSRLDGLRSPMMLNRNLVSPPITASSTIASMKRSVPMSMSEVASSPLKPTQFMSLSSSSQSLKRTPPSPIVVDVPPLSLPASKAEQHQRPQVDFPQAMKLAKGLLVGSEVDTATKLLVYGYFKQATKGDCEEAMPVNDDIKRAKWHAWRAHAGMSKDEAKASFLRVVRDNCKSS